MKKTLKKLSSLLLTAMVSLSCMNYPVHAQETNAMPTKEQFATAEELKTFDTNDNDGTTNPAKVYFGNNNQQWWIVGSQNDDSMTLFAASPLATDESFSLDQNVKSYDKDWNCTYPEGVTITEVNPDHYGASNIRARLKSLETSYFSNEEQKLMKDTTIYTDDTKNGVVYSTTDKLYLGYGDTNSHYMTVGANTSDNLNNGLHIDNTYCNKGGSSFTGSLLRRGRGLLLPGSSSAFWVLIMNAGGITSNATVTSLTSIYPAFELNLSSVLFASAASAASYY